MKEFVTAVLCIVIVLGAYEARAQKVPYEIDVTEQWLNAYESLNKSVKNIENSEDWSFIWAFPLNFVPTTFIHDNWNVDFERPCVLEFMKSLDLYKETQSKEALDIIVKENKIELVRGISWVIFNQEDSIRIPATINEVKPLVNKVLELAEKDKILLNPGVIGNSIGCLKGKGIFLLASQDHLPKFAFCLLPESPEVIDRPRDVLIVDIIYNEENVIVDMNPMVIPRTPELNKVILDIWDRFKIKYWIKDHGEHRYEYLYVPSLVKENPLTLDEFKLFRMESRVNMVRWAEKHTKEVIADFTKRLENAKDEKTRKYYQEKLIDLEKDLQDYPRQMMEAEKEIEEFKRTHGK